MRKSGKKDEHCGSRTTGNEYRCSGSTEWLRSLLPSQGPFRLMGQFFFRSVKVSAIAVLEVSEQTITPLTRSLERYENSSPCAENRVVKGQILK